MTSSEDFLQNIQELPAMPNVMIKALKIIKNDEAGIKELADIISVDQALSTKVLKLVNSAYYGFHQQITSVNRALTILGMTKAKNIVLGSALKPMMTTQGSKELWEHSIKCGVAAEYLAQKLDILNPDDAFIIGFLHDIGKMLLAKYNPVMYSKVKYIVQNKGTGIIDTEEMFFKTNHCTLGAQLCKKWQLPVILTNCIKYHHNPAVASVVQAAGLIYAADRLIQETSKEPVLESVIMSSLDFDIPEPEKTREKILAKSSIFIKEISDLN